MGLSLHTAAVFLFSVINMRFCVLVGGLPAHCSLK